MSADVPNGFPARAEALRRRLTPRSATGRSVVGALTAMAIGVSFGGAARALKSAPPQPALSITATADSAGTAAPATAAPIKAATPNGVRRTADALAASAERSAVGLLAHRLSLRAADFEAEWRGTDVRYEARMTLREAQHDPALGAKLAGILAGALVAIVALLLGTFVAARALLRRRVRRAETVAAPEPFAVPTRETAEAPKRIRFALPKLALPRLAMPRLTLPRLTLGRTTSTRRRTTPAAPVIALAAAGTTQIEIARRTGLSRDAIALALNCARAA